MTIKKLKVFGVFVALYLVFALCTIPVMMVAPLPPVVFQVIAAALAAAVASKYAKRQLHEAGTN